MQFVKQKFQRITANKIDRNPLNYKFHTDDQHAAMAAALDEIGFAGALLVTAGREKGRYLLLDGHERLDHFAPTAKVPCIVVDLDEAGARAVLATYDTIRDLAEVDQAELNALLDGVAFDHAELQQLIDEQLAPPPAPAPAADLATSDESAGGPQRETGGDDPREQRKTSAGPVDNQEWTPAFPVVVQVDSAATQAALCEQLTLEGIKCRPLTC